MAPRSSGGLSITQVITLTFGFLFASVLIFICGWWVGYDMAEQRLANEPQVVRMPAPAPPTPLPTSTATAKPTAAAVAESTAPAATPAARTATPTATRPALPTATRPPTTTRTHTRTLPPATATPGEPTATAFVPTPAPVTPIPVTPAGEAPAADADGKAAARVWTVQAFSTTDTVQAIVQQRRLRDRGYDVFIVTTQIAGTPWYQVRVGRFKERDEARAIADKLRAEEGLEGAFVASQ